MSTILIILSVLLACLIAVGGFIGYRMYRRFLFAKRLPVVSGHRQLTSTERKAVEQYLVSRDAGNTLPLTASASSPRLTRSLLSNRVYPITHSITRYGLSTDAPNKWRYFIDTQEVHLPPSWEQYITQNNEIELITTRSMPLVISLNGHSITEYINNRDFSNNRELPIGNASILPEENEHTELLSVRKETREEYATHRSRGIKDAAILCCAFLLLVFSLNSPLAVLPWLAATACILAAWSCWQLFRAPREKELQDVHCLNGTPHCLGLFGESNQSRLGNISLGNIDLIYPPHWQPYIGHDLGKKTDVDIYQNRQVVRQGKYLSLHNEVKRFPLQKRGKNLVLACGALFSLLLLLSYVPLDLPLKLSLAWIKGANNIKVTQVDELEKMPLHVGDTLQVRGTGMCYVPPVDHGPTPPSTSAFQPFDCSAIYWNKADPLPLPESDIIEKTIALRATVNEQLHPSTNGDGASSPLASAIQKSGMILLNDFSDIVLKTEDLCEKEEDCTRLKNALINLGNVKSWNVLVRRASSGALKGTSVILRPVSAETLDALVNNATDYFYLQELRNATNTLNSPPPAGFLIRSDEGNQFVTHPEPMTPLVEYRPAEQWQELQRLSAMLLHTSFEASGVITAIALDANGTRHISLHSEPDAVTLWRYLGSSVLLLLFTSVFIINVVQLVMKHRRSKQRIADIQQYYARYLAPETSATPALHGSASRPS
ncbi:intracellular growth attenuator family protein [Lonsdalea quercina]|uniref:intracellular growth attenuator family protein n=1 Tax=Lonsdalea quercina TaxID=71657 RepID=UPI00397521C0